MNFPQYTTTALEDWVLNWYIKHRFVSPKDLNLRKIAMKYEIFLHYKPIQSRYVRFGRYKEIVLNNTLDNLEQREHFFHELCHAVRHAGKQSIMPEAFRELQERDAKHFTLYAALPLHMIKKYDISDPELLERWVNDFGVSYDLCKERLNLIRRRSYCTRSF
ncbi:ImmA/IrrE family metallo-endopeptidase [Halobacillus litoralis]|uniref:ImmA/IrrE family metallo-endopeptidase n=1 Tax=Halobacillus litoralis TaxID=45668 RepID=UPI00136DCDCF|nr:ImmA/IrrE family metallo-endopeptidase [Halobacillus litoralis]MYL39053.1 ImmA/IrrE family metallo-endopeptidase [Halobacillus litoralis]